MIVLLMLCGALLLFLIVGAVLSFVVGDGKDERRW
jgi:hypothetical protein